MAEPEARGDGPGRRRRAGRVPRLHPAGSRRRRPGRAARPRRRRTAARGVRPDRSVDCVRGNRVSYLSAQLDAVETAMPFRIEGRVQAVTGMTIEAAELTLPLGSLCRIT